MNLQLQIAIPLFVCAAALIAVAILRKYKKPEVAVICLALIGAGLFSLFVPLSPFEPTEKTAVGEISRTDIASLTLAQQYMLEGCYDEAAQILDDLQKTNADNRDVLLSKARCTMLLGSYNTANLLYDSLPDAPKKEAQLAISLSNAISSQSSGAMAEYISQKGSDPGKYGFSKSEGSSTSPDEAEKIIISQIKSYMASCEEKYGKTLISCARSAADINLAFESFLSGSGYDLQSLRSSLNTLKDLVDKDISLKSNRHLRAALVRGYTVIGDYTAVAEMADENVSAEELIVLSELYLKGYVQEDDFPKSFINVNTAQRSSVLKACMKALEKNKNKLSEDEYKKYESFVSLLKESLETPALSTLKENIYHHANKGDSSLRSKCYLALAKIEQSRGNKDKTSSFISDALNSAQDSDDENFRGPMSQMLSVIQGNADSSEIKNIAQYVDSALDNSLPLDIELITPPTEYPDEDDHQNNSENGDNHNHGFGGSIDPDFGGFGNEDQDGGSDILPGDDIGFGDIIDSDKNENTEENKNQYSDEGFRNEMTEIVTQSSATLNIGVINKDAFPDIKARIQIQSSKWNTFGKIKENLKVYDCGSTITDFTLEKLEFQKSRIILLCDISGSMDSSIPKLQQAVISFADKMLPGEEVAVVGFDNGIVFIEEFTSDPKKVKKAADRLYEGGGGTALYSSLVECAELLKADINVNNIIIAMTDGQDGDSVGEGEMHNTINGLCAEKGTTGYTKGLGNGIDTAYLEYMANCGNGSFLYVETTEGLESFYDFIHGMLHNQYVLSYTAKNTTKNERKLEIAMNDEMGNAQKIYYQVDPVYTDEGADSYNPYTVEDVNLTVNGLSTKFLYKSSKDQTVLLKGKGFDKGDDITLRLCGNVRYEIKARFVDESTYEITIPSEIAVGTYDLSVSLAGNNFELKSELSIAAYGTEKTFTFGSYIFTALSSYVNDNGNTVLSGNVIMNGWLHFNGDIEISGNYAGADSVSITDKGGAYISYSTAVAVGLADTLAQEGIPLSFGNLGTFRIYSQRYNPSDYKNFPVSDIELYGAVNIFFMVAKNPSYSIYPDMIVLQGLSLSWDLPFQKQLLKDLDFTDFSSLNQDLRILIGATAIGIDEKFSYKNDNDVDFTMVSLPLRLSELEVEVNTIENDYQISAGVKFKAIKDMDELKFGFGVKGGKFDSIKLQTGGIDVSLMTTPVPISMGDFGIELSGFSKYESDNSTLSNLLGTTVTALFKVDCASLNALLPEIAKVLDSKDAALATLDDCKLSLTLKEFRLSFDAKIKLFGLLEMGKCSVSLGKFDYTNALIGYYNEEEYGLRFAITKGIDWETGELKLKYEGTGEVTLGYPYSGLWFNGTADFDVGWWIFRVDFDVTGDALIGLYKNSGGNLQFSAILRGTNSKGENSGFHIYVTGATGLGMYTY